LWKNENIDKYFNLQMYNRISGIVMLYWIQDLREAEYDCS